MALFPLLLVSSGLPESERSEAPKGAHNERPATLGARRPRKQLAATRPLVRSHFLFKKQFLAFDGARLARLALSL